MTASMEPTFWQKTHLNQVWQFIVYIALIIIGVALINGFVFQSFAVSGLSMQNTLQNGDHLVVNRIPVTLSKIQNKEYIPARGQIIVFTNPVISSDIPDQYIVKRVIAFAGERVVLKDGQYTVYNSQNPNGFNPDSTDKNQPGSPTVGSVDVTVPANTLFVSGDHRQINTSTNAPYSLDSRNGLGYIPTDDIIGPVSIRIFPFTNISTF